MGPLNGERAPLARRPFWAILRPPIGPLPNRSLGYARIPAKRP